MRPRSPLAWAGRRIARSLTKGAFEFDDAALQQHIEATAKAWLR